MNTAAAVIGIGIGVTTGVWPLAIGIIAIAFILGGGEKHPEWLLFVDRENFVGYVMNIDDRIRLRGQTMPFNDAVHFVASFRTPSDAVFAAKTLHGVASVYYWTGQQWILVQGLP